MSIGICKTATIDENERTLTLDISEVRILVGAMEAYADGWVTGTESEDFCKAWAAVYRKVHRAVGTPDTVINGNVYCIFGRTFN